MQVGEGKKSAKETRPEIISNLSLYGLHNRLFVINKFYTDTYIMEGITVLEQDEHQNITKKIVAAKGEYKDGLWTFYQSITYEFNPNGSMRHDPRYLEVEVMAITESPQDFTSQGQKLEYMNIMQLDNYIWRLSKSGATAITRKATTALYQRFTSPLTNLIIILLGIPFALMMGRRASGLSSMGVSLAMGFMYFVLDAIFIALGNGGYLMPGLAASLSHLIALTFSAILIAKLP
jgi:lipopolysaccharide export system permease protein